MELNLLNGLELNGFDRVEPVNGFSRVNYVNDDLDTVNGFSRVNYVNDDLDQINGIELNEIDIFQENGMDLEDYLDYLHAVDYEYPEAMNGLKSWFKKIKARKAARKDRRARRHEAKTSRKEARTAGKWQRVENAKKGGFFSKLADTAGTIFKTIKGGDVGGAADYADQAYADYQGGDYGAPASERLGKPKWLKAWKKLPVGGKIAIGVGGLFIADALLNKSKLRKKILK